MKRQLYPSCRSPLRRNGRPPPVRFPVLHPLKEAEPDDRKANNKPAARNDETDREDEQVHTGQNKGDGVVSKSGHDLVDGDLRLGCRGQHDVIRERASHEGCFVGGDVGADDLAGRIGGGQGYCRHDEGFEIGPVDVGQQILIQI